MKLAVPVTLLGALALFACSGEAEKKGAPIDPRQIYGQWRNVSMKLDMQTYRNSDSNYTLEVDEENWERVMNIRPIRTYFWADSTYNSMHISLQDSLIYNPSGRWLLVNDSLLMVDTFPKRGITYRYRLRIQGDLAEFTGIEDLDGDGKADDHYFGTQRKVVMKR